MEAMPDVPDVTAADDVLEALVTAEVSEWDDVAVVIDIVESSLDPDMVEWGLVSDMLDVIGIAESVVGSSVVVKESPSYVLVTTNIAGVVFDPDVAGSESLWHVLVDYQYPRRTVRHTSCLCWPSRILQSHHPQQRSPRSKPRSLVAARTQWVSLRILFWRLLGHRPLLGHHQGC